MPDVFLNPPFDAIELAPVHGSRAPAGRSLDLGGFGLGAVAGGVAALLRPEAGGRVAGRVVSLAPEALERLDFVMAAFAAERFALEGGCVAYRLRPEAAQEPAQAADFDAACRAHLSEIVVEVMAHFPRRPAGEMPRLLPHIGMRALARARGRAMQPPATLGAERGAADVEPLDLAVPYAGFFAVEEHRLRHRRFDGAMSEVLERAVFTSGDAVTVLPFDPRRGTVLLIEQFRAAVHARRDPHPWMLEVIAGRCDARETPEAAARREAREEAGLALGRIEQAAGYYTSPGITAEYITAFVAEADLAGAGGVHGLAAEDEDIAVHVLSLQHALALVASGEARNAPLLLSLLWLARHHARLAALWSTAAGAALDGVTRRG